MTEGKGPEQPTGQGMQPGPGEEHFAKFRIGEQEARQFPQPEWKSEPPDIRMQLSEDEEDRQRQEEQEFRARSEFLGREEQYSRRDPELQLLLFPENSKDIDKAVTRVIDRYTDFDLKEANSPYRLQYYMDAADACLFIFGHSTQELTDQGYVDGQIGENGYLSEDGRPKKFGYALRVDTAKREITVKEQREKRHPAWKEKSKQIHYIPKVGPEGKVESLEPVQVDVEIEHPGRTEKWEEVSRPTIRVERFYYGTDNERRALHNASKAAFERLVNTARMHDLFTILESNRADISGLVTILYLKANHISNVQWKQIFNSPDIAEITPESLENNRYGWRVDKAMRMMDLLGHAETREKMEDFMNKPTFEKIVAAAKEKALQYMEKTGYEDPEAASEDEKVARFLVGKGAVKKGGKWVLEGWMTDEQRDPANATDEGRKWWAEKDPKWARGFAAIKKEKCGATLAKGEEIKVMEGEKDVRGFLTEYGNVYARGKQIGLMHGRIRYLLGDRNAVRDAIRIFQLTGMTDELNKEVLSEKMPTAEEIIAAHRIKTDRDYNEWRKQASWWNEYFKLPGDPTGSDLSKIFYPAYYRLKDILRDRPAGPLLTTFDYDRFAQSMFSLGTTEVEIDIEDKEGKKVRQKRSLLEQWRGYAADGDMPREKAIDLGEINWDAIHIPEDLEEAAKGLTVELEEDIEEAEDLDTATKEAIKKLMKEEEDAVGGEISLWSYYTLMNWLAGRDNKIKAPWLFILDESENLRALNITETYTNKEKFLDIVLHGNAVAWGEWRKLYRDLGTTKTKEVEAHLESLARQKVQKGKRDWYKGVRNLYQFPEMMAQQVKVIRAGGTGYSEYSVPLIERVEGIPKEPGLAVRLGFMTIDDVKENMTKRLLREQELR